MDRRIADLRTDYALHALDVGDVSADPIEAFRHWFDEALAAEVTEPNGMTLATVDGRGRPVARIVLLKHVDERGFVFYTNYRSRKGRELDAAGSAALCFWWAELQRQVRIEGRVERVSAAESDAYFASRPRGSQLGAWASPQSTTLPDRDALERLFADVEDRFDGDVPRPDHWGGYRVVPDLVELWQGRQSRLHDRLCYRRSDDGWTVERLAP